MTASIPIPYCTKQ